MSVSIKTFAILVDNYDRAIEYFTRAIGLELLEDTMLSPQKRWVRVGQKDGLEILLARAAGDAQISNIGQQTAGRVGFFLQSDDFAGDYERMKAAGVEFMEEPRLESYGHVVKFRDIYGNLWDLLGA